MSLFTDIFRESNENIERFNLTITGWSEIQDGDNGNYRIINCTIADKDKDFNFTCSEGNIFGQLEMNAKATLIAKQFTMDGEQRMKKQLFID